MACTTGRAVLSVVLHAKNVHHAFACFGEVVQVFAKQAVDFKPRLVGWQLGFAFVDAGQIGQDVVQALAKHIDIAA